MDDFIPRGPHEITAKWLTSALRETGTIDRATVQSFTVSALGNDHGITGNLVRLTLSYDQDENNAPHSLIVKFATLDPGSQEILFTITFHYEREHRFYQKVASRTQLKTPRCYYSEINIEARRYILLIEDMAPVKSGDLAVGCTIEQADLAIREIAGFHAAWWNSPELKKMTWMPEFGEKQISQTHAMYLSAWDPFCQKMDTKSLEELNGIDLGLREHFGTVWSQIIKPPLTLVHADYHVENLFFMPWESGDHLVIADWQMFMFGRGAFDVAYLLGGGLDPEVRLEKEMELLSLYHSILLENGVKDYPFEQCFHDYCISMLVSLSRFIIVMGLVLTEEQAQKYWEGSASRYFTAIRDLDIGSLLPA